MCVCVVRNEREKTFTNSKSVNIVNCPIFLYYSSKNKYAKMIKRNCSLCARFYNHLHTAFFFYFSFVCNFLLHAPYVTLFMWFLPKFFFFLVFDREKKKSHCSHRFGVNVFLFCLVIVKSRFVSLSNCLSFDAHNQPIHINPNAYFIYQSKIHPFYFDMLLFPSLLFVDTTISTKPEIRAE